MPFLSDTPLKVSVKMAASGETEATKDNSAGIAFNIPVTGVDAGVHTWELQVDSTSVLKASATGDGAGGIVALSAGVILPMRLAVGNTAVIGGSTSFESNYAFESTITDFSASTLWSILTNYVTVNPSANIATTEVYANDVEANVPAANTRNISKVEGSYVQATHAGSGTVASLFGSEIYAWTDGANATTIRGAEIQAFVNSGTSVVTSTRALQLKSGHGGTGGSLGTDDTLYIRTPYSGVASTLHHGIYLEDQNVGVTSYSLYSNLGKFHVGDDFEAIARAAFGSTATFGPVASATKFWNFSETTTDFSAATTWDAMKISYVVNPTVNLTGGNAKFITGITGGISIPNTNTKNIELVTGMNISALHSGTGLITSLLGAVIGMVINNSGGATTAVGGQLSASNDGAGSTVGALYGAYFSSGTGNATAVNTLDSTVFIATPSHVGTLGSHVGLYIQAQNFGTTNYAVFAEAGKWHIEDLFEQKGIAAPAVSPATSGRLYFDSGTNKYRVSENTGAYVDLIASGGNAPSDATYVTLTTNTTLTNERVLTGTANQVIITDNGAGSTVVLSLPQSIATASSPTFAGLTLTAFSGAVSASAGVLSAGTLSVANGGTGQTSYTDGQLLIGNTTGNTLTKAALTGTANQVVVTNGSGSITLSLPQSIATTSNPTFAALTVTTINGNTFTTGTGTLTLGAGKTATISNTLTFTGTDSSSVAFGTGGTVTYTSNNLSVFAATTSAQLAGVISDETGSGALVFATSPTLVTPTLGVASATSINFGGGTMSDYVPPTNFTPTVTLVGGAGNTVPQYVNNNARYIQIGKRVFVDILLSGDGGNEGAGSGQVNIALPVAASASALGQRTPVGYYVNGGTTVMLGGVVAASATTISLFVGQGTTALTGADQNNVSRVINLRFDYEV